MKLLVVDDYQALSRAGADLVADFINARPDARVVVATGRTPMGLYRELAARRGRGQLDASPLRVFQLDAYLGLGPGDPRSLYRWMERSFLDPLGISERRVVRLPGDAPDPEGACRAYDRALQAAGGFDLAVLGLGPNGHLGFNEPPCGREAPTRVVSLTPQSVESNARYWGGPEQVPRRALTAGMAVLLTARRILLLAAGESKADILRRTLEGPINPDVPASYLQTVPGVTVIADRAAAGLLHASAR
ncbi:MAG: glucosamine-6-phosphate deaminase [Chloroflexi bacterium]|nr:glucosamine-6-phosphate deaminase [Chloroflexota bacterium]